MRKTSDSLQGKALINQDLHDIVMLDYEMSGLSDIDLSKVVIDNKLRCKVLMISVNPTIDTLLKEGKRIRFDRCAYNKAI